MGESHSFFHSAAQQNVFKKLSKGAGTSGTEAAMRDGDFHYEKMESSPTWLENAGKSSLVLRDMLL